MRRGHILEKEINKFLKYLDSVGIHGHKNNPDRTLDGTFIKGEPFDYEIICKGKVIVFDVKECNADKWRMQEKDLRQANNLVKCRNEGADAFFLVYFYRFKKLIKYDVEIAIGKKALAPSEGSQLVSIMELVR